MGEKSIRISDEFLPLYTSKKRYFFITGGRASLKSSSVHDFIARLTFERGHGVLFTRYTMTSAEKSIIPEFKATLENLGVSEHFNITRNVVTNKLTGSFIFFTGIKTGSNDLTGTLKSLAGITTLVVEEGEDFTDQKTFDTIDDSIRTAGVQNRIIWIQNPTTKEHFQYKRWILPKNRTVNFYGYNVTVSAMPEVEHIHTTYHLAEDLGYLSQGWLDKANRYRDEAEQAEDRHKTWYYYNYIGGWLERLEGVVFPKWTEAPYNTSLPYCYGLDLGYYPDPLAMIKVGIDQKRKEVYLQQQLYNTRLSTEGAALAIKSRLTKPNDLIVCDHDPRLIAEIKAHKVNIKKATKGQVSTRLKSMLDYTIFVDPDSDDLKKELNNYIWNDKKASIPIDAWNHLIDGWGYAHNQLTLPKMSMSGGDY